MFFDDFFILSAIGEIGIILSDDMIFLTRGLLVTVLALVDEILSLLVPSVFIFEMGLDFLCVELFFNGFLTKLGLSHVFLVMKERYDERASIDENEVEIVSPFGSVNLLVDGNLFVCRGSYGFVIGIVVHGGS